jgi:hypothetical protein
VTDGDHAGEVQRFLEVPEVVDARRDVLEGGGPAAAAQAAEAPILEVPDAPSAPGQIGHEPIVEVQAVARPPEPAVDEHRHRPGSAVPGRRQLAELIPAPPVLGPSGLDR